MAGLDHRADRRAGSNRLFRILGRFETGEMENDRPTVQDHPPVMPFGSAGKGCPDDSPGRQAEIDMQGEGRHRRGRPKRALGHPVLAIPGRRHPDRVRRRLQQRGRQRLVLPALLGKQRAQDGKIDLAHAGRLDVDEQSLTHHRHRRLRYRIDGTQDRVLHHGRRYGDGNVEDLALMGRVALHIGVLRIDGELLLGTGDQNRGTRNDQRPQCLQLVFLKRANRVKGPDGRQNEERIAIGMMQQRSACDGELCDEPALQNIAEIDDAIRDRPAGRIRLADDIVVSHIMVDRLEAQIGRQRLQPAHGPDHRLGDALLQALVGHGGKQVQGDRCGVA